MCLYTTNKEPFIAKEDIICYKILVKTKIPFMYKTPIVRTKLIKIPLFQKTFKAKGSSKVYGIKIHWSGVWEVAEGYIHTYLTAEAAISNVSHVIDEGEGCRIFKCIIPKGTKYFKSTESDTLASEKIVICNKIKV